MTGAPRVGIFGGTFNPIHLGHLRAAEQVTETLGLERMIFVPCAQPPHKPESADDPIAPAAERLAWVRAATAGNPRFEVDPLEIERSGPSYSVETLRALAARSAGPPPVFTIGHDAFVEVGTWREPEALFTLAHFAVIARPPVAEGTLADWLPKCVRDDVEVADDGFSARHRRAGERSLAITLRGSQRSICLSCRRYHSGFCSACWSCGMIGAKSYGWA